MSNHFSCEFRREAPDFSQIWVCDDSFLDKGWAHVKAYYFFYCAQPLVTSASIKDVRTNLREYYVKRLKIGCCMRYEKNTDSYMKVFVLNVPDNYIPSRTLAYFKFMDLPDHKIPENVLYQNIYKITPAGNYGSVDFRIDIKKPFKVLPGYKLALVCFVFGSASVTFYEYYEGTAEVFFEVN